MSQSPAASTTAEGGCRCGRLRLRVTGAPLFTAACHCRGCQRMASSAFSLTSCYPTGQFEVIAGEPVLGGLHGAARHYFCPHCLSWAFTRPDGMDDIVNLRTTLLDDPPRTPPFLETFTSEALPWAKTGAAHRFEALPPIERFPDLMAEFAQNGAAI